MLQLTKPEDLASAIRARTTDLHELTIVIDGVDGAGKSTLARALASLLEGTPLAFDDFLVREQDAYVSSIRLPDLRSAVLHSRRPLLLEGVCALEVMERLTEPWHVLVYVERFDQHGMWVDAEECEVSGPVEAPIATLGQQTKGAARALGQPVPEGSGLSPVREEIIRYHARYRPSTRADFLFRVDAAA